MTGGDARRPDLLSVVIPSWNDRELLVDCLRSLDAHPCTRRDLEIIVVDNGSEDGTADAVREGWPHVRLLVNEDNVGYTRANNQAFAARRGADVLLLNADAQVTAGCLDHLVARLDDHPRAGVVAPRLAYGDGSWQRWTAGDAPTPGSVAGHFLFLDRLPGWSRSPWLTHDVRAAFTPDWVSSACMLVRGETLDELGGLDETYATYMDDVELCRRAREVGWQVWYEPDAEAVHLMGGATRQRTGVVSPAALRNFNDYVARRHGRLAGAAVRAMQVVGFGARVAVLTLASILPGRHELRQRARAHVHHLRTLLTPRAA